jgi:tetratricopeptide (TPR) repeat protein
MSERLGHYAQAEHSFREALRLARTMKSEKRLCESLAQLGGLSAKRGQLLSGLFDIVRALRIAHRIQHVEIVCALLVSLAIGAMSLKRLNLADRWSAEALAIARRLGYSRLITLALTTRGNLESMKSRFADAEALYQEALQRAQRNQNAYDLCFTHNCIGVHYFLKHDWRQAIEQLSLSIEISTRMRMLELNGYAKFYLAQSLYESGQQAQAVATARDSLQSFQEMGYGLAHDVQRWLSGVNAVSHKGIADEIGDDSVTDKR